MSALALLGGEKAKSKPFPIWPHYDEAEECALKQVLESRIWWRTPGTKTLEFEQAFAKFHGAKHGIAVTNGTAALEVTMAGLGIALYVVFSFIEHRVTGWAHRKDELVVG